LIWKRKGVLTCSDGNVAFTKKIDYTDFRLGRV
jgi:hypothetical protein